MLAVFTVTVVAVTGIAVESGSDIANSWAQVLNTLLLVILAVYSNRNRVVLKDARGKVEDVHVSVNHAAVAAASAAESAAVTARIAKDLGARQRQEDKGQVERVKDDTEVIRKEVTDDGE